MARNPYVDSSLDRALANAREVNPAINDLTLPARSGESLHARYDWMRREVGGRAHDDVLVKAGRPRPAPLSDDPAWHGIGEMTRFLP